MPAEPFLKGKIIFSVPGYNPLVNMAIQESLIKKFGRGSIKVSFRELTIETRVTCRVFQPEAPAWRGLDKYCLGIRDGLTLVLNQFQKL